MLKKIQSQKTKIDDYEIFLKSLNEIEYSTMETKIREVINNIVNKKMYSLYKRIKEDLVLLSDSLSARINNLYIEIKTLKNDIDSIRGRMSKYEDISMRNINDKFEDKIKKIRGSIVSLDNQIGLLEGFIKAQASQINDLRSSFTSINNNDINDVKESVKKLKVQMNKIMDIISNIPISNDNTDIKFKINNGKYYDKNSGKWVCPYCNKLFNSNMGLWGHLKLHYRDGVPPRKDTSRLRDGIRKFILPGDIYLGSSVKHLIKDGEDNIDVEERMNEGGKESKKGRKRQKKQKKRVCPKCGAEFKNYQALNAHLRYNKCES